VAVLLVACTTTSPGSSSSPPGSSSPVPGNSVDFSPQPTSPAQILFRLERREEQLSPLLARLTLYGDGRLLSWDPARDDLMVRTLSSAGVDAFLAEVLNSGFFAESHDVTLQPLPGQEPPDVFTPGIGVDSFSLSPPSGPAVTVTTTTVDDPGNYATSPEREALTALAGRLSAADWLPPEDWTIRTPIRYVADAYLLLSGSLRFPPDSPICPGGGGSSTCARDVDTVAWPVTLPPDGIGPPFTPPNGEQSTAGHCAVISFSFASSLAAAMQPGPGGGLGGHLYVTASIAWRAQNAFYELRLRPLLPEESVSCAGKNLFPDEGPQV
jgi:hypothetical protein